MTLNHLAIIPDGNRRWAKAHRLLPWEGHKVGFQERIVECIKYSKELGIENLTIWIGSFSNLSDRTKDEVAYLFKLAKDEFISGKFLSDLHANETKMQFVGEWASFTDDQELLDLVKKAEEETFGYTKHKLTFLFGYDGQREMLGAIKKLTQAGEEVTEQNLRKNLWTGFLPDVDLVIRTGGEPHWSAGFMMWHTANSQFYFTETLWPDFGREELKKAVDEFDRRERRMGK